MSTEECKALVRREYEQEGHKYGGHKYQIRNTK
jgi:hypothetical protein